MERSEIGLRRSLAGADVLFGVSLRFPISSLAGFSLRSIRATGTPRMQLGRLANPYVLILPSFLLAAFIILWPLKELVQIATHDVNRFGQLRDFSGVANFAALLADPDFVASVWRTLIWTVGGGRRRARHFAARGAHPQRGFLRPRPRPRHRHAALGGVADDDGNRLALGAQRRKRHAQLGAARASVSSTPTSNGWREASTAFPMQILIGILVIVPFTVTIFLGGLSSIPQDIYEAAAIEGAGRWQQFRNITLPLLRPFINIALVLNTIYVFNSFPIIWAMTQGGPANSTDILVTYLYKLGLPLREARRGGRRLADDVRHPLVFTLIYVRLAMREESATMKQAHALDPVWLLLSPLDRADPLSLRGDVHHRDQAAARGARRRRWWPSEPRFSNFVEMWEETQFRPGSAQLASTSRRSRRSAPSLVAIPAAYALSRYRSPAAAPIRQFLLISQMLSPIVLVLGLFRLRRRARAASTTSTPSCWSTPPSTSPSRSGCCRAISRPSRRSSRRRPGWTAPARRRRCAASFCRSPCRRWR